MSGSGAREIARISFSGGLTEPRVATYGSWLDAAGNPIDSGIQLFFPAPNSYTGEDVIEMQAHGSPLLLQALLQRAIELGAEPAQPGEFTRRAVENGRMDLSQAEAVIACIDAATLRAARLAHRQLSGVFGERITTIMDSLTSLVAGIEACLDFPEEEIPPALFSGLEERARQEVIEPLQSALGSASFGERLFEGARVAIIGSPNVGKSSLLNILAGYDRAIVSDIPGTTRDVIEVDFEVHGIPVRLVDTAGLRDSEDTIEQEGMARARAAASDADVVIFVADATDLSTWEHGASDVQVMNKCDLNPGGHFPDGFIHMSVKEASGIDQLQDRLAALLGDEGHDMEEALLVTRARHRFAIEKALAHALAGTALLDREEQLDLAALEWRQAWSALGEILGVGDVEHILDRIFRDFCIGK